jgi:hypothetical protein
MVVKEWVYRDYRIALELAGGDYRSLIHAPGNPEALPYTPVVEMKHGEQRAQKAAEKFVDHRLEMRRPTS